MLDDLPEPIAKAITNASGFIFDMDGTIALGNSAGSGHEPLPDAVALLKAIKRCGIPVRVFTNGTAKPPVEYAQSLRRAGFDLDDGEMMTPSSTAAAWYVRNRINKVRVLGISGSTIPLADAGIEVVGPSEKATGVQAVYSAWYREFGFSDLEAACNDIWNGAKLTTASNVPFFASANGRAIGSSYAVNAMISAMTKARTRVLGKPALTAFSEACRQMNVRGDDRKRMVIVGDDPALEMRMARGAGVMGVGMTTGIMTRESVKDLRPSDQPHVLVDSLTPLLRAFS